MFSPSSSRLNLLLIDNDPQFRQKFVARLTVDASLKVVLEADSAEESLRLLQQWSTQSLPEPDHSRSLDLVVLSLELPPVGTAAVLLCQTLRRQYPALPILTMSQGAVPAVVMAVFQLGTMGYCRKDTPIEDWIEIIRQVVAGVPFWVQGMEALGRSSMVSSPGGRVAAPVVRNSGLGLQIRSHLRRSGLAQIDAAIANISEQLKNPTLTALDQFMLTGQRRELRAARWLVSQLLPSSRENMTASTLSPSLSSPAVPAAAPEVECLQPQVDASLMPQVETQAIRSVQAALFDGTFAKLQLSLRNLTDIPLEIDILQDDRKRELLTIVLRQLEELLAELRFSQVDMTQLWERREVLLLDLWQAATNEFFGRYTTVVLSDTPTDPLNGQPVPMVDVLVRDGAIVRADILNKIPLVPEFLAHLLYQTPLMVNEASYAVGTVEAMNRMEALLQHLMIQVGNAVMQPVLNRFGNVVAVKQNFYDRRLLSTREIERFRNHLSWRYRVQRYVEEPIAIFESRYVLFVLAELGIRQQSIYSPRSQELEELTGIGLAVTLTVEARDAIAPRLRSIVSLIGSGVVYILTEIIGRGIGLIGRGIIKGVGNVIHDPTFNRDSQRWRG